MPFVQGCSIELSLTLPTTWYLDSSDLDERLIAISFPYKPDIRKGVAMKLNPIPAYSPTYLHHPFLKQSNPHTSSCVCCLHALPALRGWWSSGSPVGMSCR